MVEDREVTILVYVIGADHCSGLHMLADFSIIQKKASKVQTPIADFHQYEFDKEVPVHHWQITAIFRKKNCYEISRKGNTVFFRAKSRVLTSQMTATKFGKSGQIREAYVVDLLGALVDHRKFIMELMKAQFDSIVAGE